MIQRFKRETRKTGEYLLDYYILCYFVVHLCMNVWSICLLVAASSMCGVLTNCDCCSCSEHASLIHICICTICLYYIVLLCCIFCICLICMVRLISVSIVYTALLVCWTILRCWWREPYVPSLIYIVHNFCYIIFVYLYHCCDLYDGSCSCLRTYIRIDGHRLVWIYLYSYYEAFVLFISELDNTVMVIT